MSVQLATKGVINRPSGLPLTYQNRSMADTHSLRMATKGIAGVRTIVIVEEVVTSTPPGGGQSGGGRISPSRPLLKKIKVTVLFSGDISVQELMIDPKLSVKAQVLDVVSGITNPIFITVRHKP